MLPRLLTALLVLSFVPIALSQIIPISLFERRQLHGCQYSSLTDGTYIYFIDQSDTPLHYSIYTPWTRFYPDALRADLVEQGFTLGAQHGKNESDLCGWETMDVVKKHGWLRGKVSFRHIHGKSVKIKEAGTKAPAGTKKLPMHQTNPVGSEKVNSNAPASVAVHPLNHTRRAAPQPTMGLRQELRPSNDTRHRICNVLVSNSPEADLLFMMLEISLPIIGVIAFLTLVLLIMRHVTNKLYPDTDEDNEQGNIELSSMRKSKSVKSDRTLVNPKKLSKFRTTGRNAEDRFPDTKDGGVFAWRLAMENPPQPRQSPNVRTEDRYLNANTGGFVGLSIEQSPQPRQSSSIYSRSMDGVTLYPERNTGSWGSR
ncbi:uncharacterized protein N0V89_005738 [Didymosphaeria variabile]|uniref:Uncharacterized protein n=1 Tax=Didymosphaeria variabile TaxID=1932322 RepID=A0A9W9CAR7_9PLEO|nr:uncharacterized protein N0V89_005738 [Didymosphaeria variabile]KAJ4354006.1 hypothetical protein N0V89_005738 [Didymosphaeria variabile]